MSQMQFMRRLKVPVPEELREVIRQADFLRFGIIYGRPVINGPYYGRISIYAVPKHGGEPCWSFPLVKEVPLKTDNASNYAATARALATDKQRLISLIKICSD